jgi:hypothetical protein
MEGEVMLDMDNVIKLVAQDSDIIVISDSNTAIIEGFLEFHGLLKYFKDVFAHPATITDDGFLQKSKGIKKTKTENPSSPYPRALY